MFKNSFFFSIDYFVIILGTISLKTNSVGSLKMISYSKISHEDYNEFGNNDIALVELPENVQLSGMCSCIFFLNILIL